MGGICASTLQVGALEDLFLPPKHLYSSWRNPLPRKSRRFGIVLASVGGVGVNKPDWILLTVLSTPGMPFGTNFWCVVSNVWKKNQGFLETNTKRTD